MAAVTNDLGERVEEGYYGNLSPEHTQALKEFWRRFYEITDSNTERSEELDQKGGAKAGQTGKEGAGVDTQAAKSKKGSQQDAKKTQELKAVNEAVTKYGGPYLNKAMWEMCQTDAPDMTALRFLRARQFDVDRTLGMLAAALQFRLDMNVEEILLKGEEGHKDEPGFLNQFRRGISYLEGSTEDMELPLYFIHVARHFTSAQKIETLQKFVALAMENSRLMLTPPVEKTIIVFDMAGFGLKNMDWQCVLFIVKCLEAFYPESLQRIYIHGAPWIFKGIWAGLQPLLDPVVQAKIKFSSKASELEEYIPKSRLRKGMGGTLDWDWEYKEPVPGESALLEETETRDAIRKEYDVLTDAFERATKEWVDAQGDDELDYKRRVLSKQLRLKFFQLRPYIRAVNVYQRTKVLRNDGVVTWTYPQVSGEVQKQVVGTRHAVPALIRWLQEHNEDTLEDSVGGTMSPACIAGESYDPSEALALAKKAKQEPKKPKQTKKRTAKDTTDDAPTPTETLDTDAGDAASPQAATPTEAPSHAAEIGAGAAAAAAAGGGAAAVAATRDRKPKERTRRTRKEPGKEPGKVRRKPVPVPAEEDDEEPVQRGARSAKREPAPKAEREAPKAEREAAKAERGSAKAEREPAPKAERVSRRASVPAEKSSVPKDRVRARKGTAAAAALSDDVATPPNQELAPPITTTAAEHVSLPVTQTGVVAPSTTDRAAERPAAARASAGGIAAGVAGLAAGLTATLGLSSRASSVHSDASFVSAEEEPRAPYDSDDDTPIVEEERHAVHSQEYMQLTREYDLDDDEQSALSSDYDDDLAAMPETVLAPSYTRGKLTAGECRQSEASFREDIHASHEALQLFLNSQMHEAEALYAPNAHSHLYCSLGMMVINSVKALMTFEPNDLQTAIECCRHTSSIAEFLRKKPSVLTRWLPTRGTPTLSSMSFIEQHAELVYAESQLMTAALGILYSGSTIGAIRQTTTIVGAYKILRELLRMTEASPASVDEDFRSGVYFSNGLVLLILALLPKRALRVVEGLGYGADRHRALELFARAGGWSKTRNGPGIDARREGLRRPLCDLAILSYHLIVSAHVPMADVDLAFADKVLSYSLTRYSQGVFYLYFSARLYALQALPEKAIESYREAIKSQRDYKQLHHLCFWSLSLTYLTTSDFDRAYECYDVLSRESNWSKAIYQYAKAAMLYEASSHSRAQSNAIMRTVPSLVKRVTGRHLPFEKFVLRKAEKFGRQSLVGLTAMEFSYLWHCMDQAPVFMLMANQLKRLDEVIDELEAYTSPSTFGGGEQDFYSLYCLAFFLRGVALRYVAYPEPHTLVRTAKGIQLDAHEVAEDAIHSFNQVFTYARYLDDVDRYLVYFAHYELGCLYNAMGNQLEARVELEKVQSRKPLTLQDARPLRSPKANYLLSGMCQLRAEAALEGMDMERTGTLQRSATQRRGRPLSRMLSRRSLA